MSDFSTFEFLVPVKAYFKFENEDFNGTDYVLSKMKGDGIFQAVAALESGQSNLEFEALNGSGDYFFWKNFLKDEDAV